MPPRDMPPRAEKRPVTSVHHGTTLIDDYAWLRAENWQDVMRDPGVLDTAIRAHLEAENAYTEARLADTKALQVALFEEMKGRIKEDDTSVPAPDGPFEYQSGYVTGGQYPRLLRRARGAPDGSETVLLDGNAEAEGKAYWQLGGAAHSHDHKLLAYAVDEKGSELFTVRIRDMATGRDLPDAIPDTRGGVVWARDGKTFFYVRLDANHRPLYVYRHVVGTPAESDALVYEEQNPGFYVGVGATQSGRFILIDAHDHQTSEVYLLDADRPTDPMRLVAAREHGHEYAVEHHGDRLLGERLGNALGNGAAGDAGLELTHRIVGKSQADHRVLLAHSRVRARVSGRDRATAARRGR
jgi:oligopeptidase B